MPHEPDDDHPGPTKTPPPEPQGEPMVGKPTTPPEEPTNALHSTTNCISFAAAARKKRRFHYSRQSTARAALVPAAPSVVVVLASHEMRLRFGIEDRTEAEGTATDALE